MSPNAISDLSGQSVLVTGGAGFIGTPLVDLLLRGGARVLVVDDLSVGRPMPPAHPALTAVVADIRDRARLADLCAGFRPAAVIHLAAVHHIPTCERDPHHAMDVNVMGFQSVLDAAAQAGCDKVVLASSGAVYHWADHRLTETSPVSPQDVYAATKAANEHQLAAWCNAGHGAGIVARLFNVIGPDDPNGHLIPDILSRLDGCGAAPVDLVMGNLDRRRDFVDVTDMAAGLAAVLTRGWAGAGGVECFNLCSGHEVSVQDIALTLAERMGVQVRLTSSPNLRRQHDRSSQWGDPAKSLHQLGWRAARPLTDSIDSIIACHRRRHCS